MERRKNLVAIGPESQADEAAQAADSAEFVADVEVPSEPVETYQEEWLDDEPETRIGRFSWVVPTLAILVVLGWTGFFGWVHQAEILSGATPAQWSEWIIAWSAPVLLVVAL